MVSAIRLHDMPAVKDELFMFVWDFKHGDNVFYNFETLKALYEARESLANGTILNKPITITIVSIIEAILIDFLTRIDEATNHLPAGVDRETLDEIKDEIKKKMPIKIEDDFGERIYMKRKMYHFNEIVRILSEHEIFGDKRDDFYEKLFTFGDMRNRVHIENYYQNFEERENRVFTSGRLSELEAILSDLWERMCTVYKRPWQRS